MSRSYYYDAVTRGNRRTLLKSGALWYYRPRVSRGEMHTFGSQG